MNNGQGAGVRLAVLTAEDLARVHAASLAILEGVGVRVDAPAARTVLQRAGARFVAASRCLISAELVAAALASAPRTFPLFDRLGEPAFMCGSGSTRFGIGVTNLYYEEPETGAVTPFRREHMAASARLGHALSQYDVVSTVGVLQDAPPETADLIGTLEMAANTTKPLVLLVSDPAQFGPCLELLAALGCGSADRPAVLPYVNPITPLVLNVETTDKLTAAINRGLPVIFSNYGMAGASTPLAPFRALALLNAELLAGLVFSQAVRPGAAMMLGSLPAYFDMRTMVDFYDPRSMLINLACSQMLAHYGIPHVGASGSGNGWGPDVIAAGELWFNHLTACIGGVGLAPFVGGNLGSKVFSPAAVVLGAEIIEQVRTFARGFDPTESDGLLAEIQAAGPGGSFFESAETLRRVRTGYHTSRIFPHYGLEKWQELGRPSAEARLRAATVEMMRQAQSPADRDELLGQGRALLQRLGR